MKFSAEWHLSNFVSELTSSKLIHQLGFWKIFVIVMVLAIATQLIAAIPFLGLLLIFLQSFIIMIYIAIYENAIGNLLEAGEDK